MASTPICPLLDLPPELRTRIYEHVFTLHQNPDQPVWIIHYEPTRPPTPTILSILQTCRLIHAEAAGLFYHLNHLHIHAKYFSHHPSSAFKSSIPARCNFIEALGPRRLAGIHRLTIDTHALEQISTVCRKLGAADPPLLRTLRVHFQHVNGSPSAERAFRVLSDDARRESHWILRGLRKVQALETVTVALSVQWRTAGIWELSEAQADVLNRLAEEVSRRWNQGREREARRWNQGREREARRFRWEFS